MSKPIGEIEVSLIQANNLEAKDSNGYSDP